MRILIDGDLIAYKIASSNEHPIEWDDGLWTLHSDANEVINEVDQYLEYLIEGIEDYNREPCDAIIALTSRQNFRKDVNPDYKANRKKQRKPLCLNAVREHLQKEWDVCVFENLEADDVISILASEIDSIIVSDDKDLDQVAGHHWVDGELVKVGKTHAYKSFIKQVLTGDASDNYKGCSGIGPVKASRLLDKVPVKELWPVVVEAYEKAGQSEDDAILNARMAYLLKTKDYNKQTKEVNLWMPQ
tara:strand:+ start:193 stop:927 length:735 start_codon:yes stop_codon:yes gene_type:complete